MEGSDRCCGSAGIYNVVQNEMSMQVLSSKMGSVNATKASIVATANPGCMLQLDSGLRQAGLPIEVKHVVELLDEAYGGGPAMLQSARQRQRLTRPRRR
jgi:glycolate oxidase iron-sulfur subunit